MRGNTVVVSARVVGQTVREIRTRLMTPSRRQVDPDVRGFASAELVARENLERAGNGFLDGYTAAMRSADAVELHARMEDLDDHRRGFAYEGAGMALAILDGLPGSHGRYLRRFLDDAGDAHVYMVYVGAGWALARLPRARWRAAARGLRDPVLTWLTLDGYGFHQAFFRTGDYVDRARRPQLTWPHWDRSEYAPRAVDQGIGRALWFVEGADPIRVRERITRFEVDRRSDLYAGVGLAATYAAGARPEELTELRVSTGGHAAALSQGSVFAAEARFRAGNVTAETEAAVGSLTGLPVLRAAEIARVTRPSGRFVEGVPSYEHWRCQIMARFVPESTTEHDNARPLCAPDPGRTENGHAHI